MQTFVAHQKLFSIFKVQSKNDIANNQKRYKTGLMDFKKQALSENTQPNTKTMQRTAKTF